MKLQYNELNGKTYLHGGIFFTLLELIFKQSVQKKKRYS